MLVHPKECLDIIESDKAIYSKLSASDHKLILLPKASQVQLVYEGIFEKYLLDKLLEFYDFL